VASGPGAVGEATVSWDAPESDGGTPVLAFLVYRDGALVAQLDAEARAFTDAGLTPFEAHSYQISAMNAVGEGAASDAACGMPSPWTPELGCGLPL
jgi:levanase